MCRQIIRWIEKKLFGIFIEFHKLFSSSTQERKNVWKAVFRYNIDF